MMERPTPGRAIAQAVRQIIPPVSTWNPRSLKDSSGAIVDDGKTRSASTKMALLLNNSPRRHVYAGTVDQATVQHRRAANKRARKARRVHRLAANR